ncbi:SRPBCC domain-containing protein [Rhizobium sp. AB2/73]|uniref:SRPBCC family protein n=1 Tax=Rhizobium sp. AB2/73 TaxID=2795216 RepID=UPI001C605C13|nr:SRPBCC domain-containing protein [Rhizobium sp. AB2/73]QYA13193.1 SRPBCC domain-containing protein [Rhizobium sp. AB2/73]UEQ80874.1 SRPBCC domain-containing protein [Rhizobium sp. AB2/73]
MSLYSVTHSIRIKAARKYIWEVLTSPDAGELWRNAHFTTGWQVGDAIQIEAVIGTKRYRDKGRVVRNQPHSLLQYTYWSRVSGLPDVPESYSTITFSLTDEGTDTILTVEQLVPPSPVRRGKGWEIGEESGRKHVDFYWRTTLPVLKRVVEKPDSDCVQLK